MTCWQLQVRDWVKPVAEDYMSTSAFPSHPFVPWRRMSIFSLIPALFREHLARSKEPSASVRSLVADYKKQKMPFMTSLLADGGIGRSETDIVSQRASRRGRKADIQSSAQKSQALSVVSRSSESSEAI